MSDNRLTTGSSVATSSRPSVADSVVLLAGTVRNSGRALEQSLVALRHAAAGFRDLRVLIVESDSTNNNVTRLAALSDEPTVRTISLGALRHAMPLRTERIAHSRNRIVEEVQSARYADVDYVILADFDGVNRTVTRVGLESAWSAPEPWDVVTANQTGPYYDIWALRHPHWCPGDCWASVRALTPVIGRRAARRLAVHARQVRLPVDAGLIEVDSAFGGLGIYSRSAFVSGRYVGVDTEGNEICEHVSFHADLRAAGFRIFINPSLQNQTQRAHLGGAGSTASAVRRVLARKLGITG